MQPGGLAVMQSLAESWSEGSASSLAGNISSSVAPRSATNRQGQRPAEAAQQHQSSSVSVMLTHTATTNQAKKLLLSAFAKSSHNMDSS